MYDYWGIQSVSLKTLSIKKWRMWWIASKKTNGGRDFCLSELKDVLCYLYRMPVRTVVLFSNAHGAHSPARLLMICLIISASMTEYRCPQQHNSNPHLQVKQKIQYRTLQTTSLRLSCFPRILNLTTTTFMVSKSISRIARMKIVLLSTDLNTFWPIDEVECFQVDVEDSPE